MAKSTSRVFATWQALYDLLEAQTWPGHSTTGQTPEVVFGATRDLLLEAVVVVGTPPVGPTLEWVTNLSEEDVFSLQVRVVSEVPGVDIGECIARVAELADVVQTSLRSTATGRMTNAFNGASPTNPVPGVISWRVSQVRSTAYPTTEGFGGYAELDVLFKSRI